MKNGRDGISAIAALLIAAGAVIAFSSMAPYGAWPVFMLLGVLIAMIGWMFL